MKRYVATTAAGCAMVKNPAQSQFGRRGSAEEGAGSEGTGKGDAAGRITVAVSSEGLEAWRVAEHFAPFVRDSPPFSLPEKALTFLVGVTLAPLRFLGLLLVLASVYLVSAVSLTIFPDIASSQEEMWRPPSAPRRVTTFLIRLIIRAGLFLVFGVFSIDLRLVDGAQGIEPMVPIVANHLGCAPDPAKSHLGCAANIFLHR